MTRSEIDAVLDRVRTWPLARQQRIAAALLAIEQEGDAPYRLSDEERGDIRAGLAEAARGEFATEMEMSAILSGR